MSFELQNTILKMPLGKTAKLVLAVMACNDLKKKWLVKELVEYIGGDSKTIRFAMKDLLEQQFVIQHEKTRHQANLFTLNTARVLVFSELHSVEIEIENDLTRLARQAQRHHPKHNNLSKQTKKL